MSEANEPQQTKSRNAKLAPITFGRLRKLAGRVKESRLKTIRILFDSGASETIIQSSLVKNLKSQKTNTQVWNIAAGKVATNKTAKIMFNMPEFYESKIVQCWAHVFDAKLSYDMIIGRDLMTELGIKIDFENLIVHWKEAEVPMRDPKNNYKRILYSGY